MDPKTLNNINLGERCIVDSVRCEGNNDTQELRHKLLTMGVVPGTEIEVTNVAPLGDPITVRLHRFSLSLRRSEASVVVVKEASH
jgi:Fe2+ transport system protein FeoA